MSFSSIFNWEDPAPTLFNSLPPFPSWSHLKEFLDALVTAVQQAQHSAGKRHVLDATGWEWPGCHSSLPSVPTHAEASGTYTGQEHGSRYHGETRSHALHVTNRVRVGTIPTFTALTATRSVSKHELKRQGVETKEVGKGQRAQNP